MDITFEFHPSLDRTYLASFYEEDWEYAYEMFDLFQEAALEALEAMKAAQAEKNHEELGRQIHKLRPSFMMVGLKELYQMADEVESRGAEDYDFEGLSAAAGAICEKMEAIMPMIRKETQRLQKLID